MKQITFYFILISVVLASCYPNGAEYYDQTEIVYTNYESDFNFSSKGTYAIPDKIVQITGNELDGTDPEFVKEPYNTQLLSQIEDNMTAYGWQKIDDPEQADLVLFVGASVATTVYYWYDYWCWWYPYYCGWGYYPYYGYAYSSYTTGSLVMSLVEDGDDHIQPYVVWTGIANGLADGSGSITAVTNSIDQAYTQSPYLKVN